MISLSLITDRSAVVAAIQEYEDLGSDAFLARYQFKTSARYLLWYCGRSYDPKAILAVAFGHQFPSLGPLHAEELIRAEEAAVQALRSLGFEVSRLLAAPAYSRIREMKSPASPVALSVAASRPSAVPDENGRSKKNPNWVRDEVILALDLYFRVNPRSTNPRHPEIVALSALLNRLPIHSPGNTGSKFRNPNGVYMKMCNLLRLDPTYPGAALRSGGKIEQDVWRDFAHQRSRLDRVASAIRAASELGTLRVPALSEPDVDEPEEGVILARYHRLRERDQAIGEAKKAQVLAHTGTLICEVCGVEGKPSYVRHQDAFIECHHTVPLSLSDPLQATRLEELALVCANCHRRLHRGATWPALSHFPREASIPKFDPKVRT